MTTTIKLTDTQIAIIKAAAGRPDSNIKPLPTNLRGGARAKVMIGGAAVTQDYADSCGADAYAADGVKAVKLAKQIVGVE